MTTGSSPAGASREARSAEELENTNSDTELANAGGEGNADANSPSANSSDAGKKDANEPKTLAEVIKKAAGDAPKGDAENGDGKSSTPEAKDGKQVEAKSKDGEGENKPEDAKDKDKDLPFHNHPRWKEVLAERDGFKSEADEYRKITGFMEQSSLSAEEVADGFLVMAALKNEPARAYEMLAPIMDNLRRHLGLELPDDLKTKVDQGFMDEESARETARLRGERTFKDARSQEERTRQDAARQADDARNARAANGNAVRDWETSIRGSDPDYAKKQGAVLRYSRALIAERGAPRTPDEAVALVKDAYAQVNADFGVVVPKRSSTPRSPSSGGSSSPSARPAPTSLAEAVRLAARG